MNYTEAKEVVEQDMHIFTLCYIINGRVKEELVKIKDNLLLTGTEKNTKARQEEPPLVQ